MFLLHIQGILVVVVIVLVLIAIVLVVVVRTRVFDSDDRRHSRFKTHIGFNRSVDLDIEPDDEDKFGKKSPVMDQGKLLELHSNLFKLLELNLLKDFWPALSMLPM